MMTSPARVSEMANDSWPTVPTTPFSALLNTLVTLDRPAGQSAIPRVTFAGGRRWQTRIVSSFSRLPVRHVGAGEARPAAGGSWPYSIAAVSQLLREGLDLGALTVLVGENGSGKSTVVEAIAGAYGMSAEGGSTGARHSSRPSESVLSGALSLRRGIGASRWGFFLRAETMHGFYSYLERNPGSGRESTYHEMSHGESFLQLIDERFGGPGLYVLDEPESALSFAGCLSLVRLLLDIAGSGTAQAIVATHSPIIAAVPGARVLELGEWGMQECPWEELALTQNWRAFLQSPERYLRHLG
jgi:predicted ATPase